MTGLPPQQQVLFDTLLGRGDVPWLVLYEVIKGSKSEDINYVRQYLGPYVTRLNRRLAGQKLRVVPGKLKRTYCLVSVR